MSKKFIIQKSPFVVPPDDGKLIKEHFGLVSEGDSKISIARMTAPPHWKEGYQTPEFDEFTLILSGKKKIIVQGESIILEQGQSIKIEKNTRVQYSNPFDQACEYISICIPAFSINSVNRENL